MKTPIIVTAITLILGTLGANAQWSNIPNATFADLAKPCNIDTVVTGGKKPKKQKTVITCVCNITHKQLEDMKELKTGSDEVSIHSFKLSFKTGESLLGMVHDGATLRTDVHSMMINTEGLKEVRIHELRLKDTKGKDWPEGDILLMIE